MSTTETWYTTQRAESLAVMHLTRRDDLIVSRQREDYGLDLLVTISKDGRQSGRIFGVEVKASYSLPASAKQGSRFRIHYRSGFAQALYELPFPVCVFHFTMEDDKGYYKWILEPEDEPGAYPILKHITDTLFTRLTDGEISKIVNKVNHWYDRRS